MQDRTLSDLVVALIRTVTPVLVGSVIAFVALPPTLAPTLEILLVTLATALYYLAARYLAARWPAFGWLLGYPADPEYKPLIQPPSEQAD